jgi:hypothetical protein
MLTPPIGQLREAKEKVEEGVEVRRTLTNWVPVPPPPPPPLLLENS